MINEFGYFERTVLTMNVHPFLLLAVFLVVSLTMKVEVDGKPVHTSDETQKTIKKTEEFKQVFLCDTKCETQKRMCLEVADDWQGMIVCKQGKQICLKSCKLLALVDSKRDS